MTAPSVEVSVVMGVYNGSPYLPDSIDCMLAQEGVELEFVIVDDGSTDATPGRLADYARRDSRVRILRQENGGLTRALITGCLAARGRYIARQDDGDISVPSRLRKQAAALDAAPDVVFVSSWSDCGGPELEPLFSTRGDAASAAPRDLLAVDVDNVAAGPTSHSSVMFRRDVYMEVGGYRDAFYYGQDWDLWYRLAEAGKFQIIEEALCVYRLLPTGISYAGRQAQVQAGALSREAARRRRRGEPEADVLEQARRVRPPVGGRGQSAWSVAAGYYMIGECLRRNRDARSLRYFRMSLHRCPLFVKSWLRALQAVTSLRASRGDGVGGRSPR